MTRTGAARACLPTLLAAVLAGLLILPADAGAQGRLPPVPAGVERANPMRAPVPGSSPRLPLGNTPQTDFSPVLARPVESTPQPLFLGLLRFYRTGVSPLNGSNSDLAPVHSLYAVEAIQTHGVLLGTVLTTGRLLGEASAIPHGPRFVERGRAFTYDPLAWNIYWLPAWLRAE